MYFKLFASYRNLAPPWSFRAGNHDMLKSLIMRMKLVALLLTITCVHLFAATSAQIRLKTVKAPLAEVVKEIEQKSQYIFFYDQKLLELSDPVTVDIAAKDIRTVLQMVFSGQSKLGFKIVGKTIVIKESHEKEQNILKNQKEARPATASIRGEVLDENNKPLPGATVRIKGTSLVTTTDRNGDFTLDPGTDANCTLSISFVGYKTKEVDVYSRASSIIVKLEPAETMLDQVQLIGYGTTSKRVSTGNVTTVTAKEIQQQPVTNVLTALEGRVPGLFITQNSGQPGTGVNITLRAAASLASGTNPLFIVDGVPYASEPLYTAGGNPNVANLRPAAGSSPLNSINPTDIESISILKDADATAIYGSRGANGVILITTKKGKANETSLNINFSKGISNVPGLDRVKKASLAEYLEVRRQAYANSGTTPSALEAPDLLTWSQTQTSDLPKLLFGRTAPNTDLTASLTGGSSRTTFLLSGVYHDEGQVSPGDYSYRRGGGHLNISHTVPSQKFGIDATVTYNLDQNSGPLQPGALTDLANIGFITPVNYPIYDGTGKLYWVNDPNTSIINPLSYLNRSYKGSTNNLIGNLTIKYHPVKDLNLKVSSSYNRNQLYQQYLYPSTAINPFTGIKPSSLFQENYTTAWNIEPQADYTIYLKDHHINLLAGSTFQSNAYVQPFSIQANNFESDYLLTDYNSAESVRTSSFESKYKYASVFGRANYNYLNKYIFNFNYRWDASSKFGINNRFGSFYSVGGAWVFTEEELLKKNLSWISFGKLRGSYGRTGNDQISNYQFFDTYSPSFATYDNTPTIYPNNVANPDLKWEVNHKLEAALDLNFLKDRISLSASYFINRTNNPLVSFPLANVSGFASYTANMPATVKSYGPEFELSTENIKTTSFRWNSSFNISFPQNKLVRFDAIERTSYVDTYIVGQSLNLLTGFRYSGISPQTNLPVFLDANGDGVNNYAQVGLAAYGRGDYVMIGRTTPDFFGGFNNTFTYKGFQLNVFVQFSGKRMIPGVMSPSFAPGIGGLGSQPYAITAQAYDLFKATGGKIATTDFNFDPATPFGAYYMYQYSNAVLSNAAFARLKTVSMAYNFPAKINQKFHLKNGQLFLRGQNLLTVTKFSGYDPETPASNIPPLRTFVVGLNCSF